MNPALGLALLLAYAAVVLLLCVFTKITGIDPS